MQNRKRKTVHGASSIIGALLISIAGCGGAEPPPPGPEPTPVPESTETPDNQPTAVPTPESSAATEAQPSSQDSISEAEIETFAEIQIQLVTLQQQLTQRAEQGADQAELKELQARLEIEAMQIVERSDLGTQRFNEIAERSQHDASLQERIRRAIENQLSGG